MTDIVKRLRTLYSNYRGGVADAAADGCDDAADEIERLLARLAVLEERVQGYERWLAYIYNLRGYAMTDEVWNLFARWCEVTGIYRHDPPKSALPRGTSSSG